MRLFRHYAGLPTEVRGGVVALGNFDGVHLGHQAVVRMARDIGRASAWPTGVMTFEPHPRAVFAQKFAQKEEPFRLTPFRIKARAIAALGVDFLIVQRFDLSFANYMASEFIERVLVAGIGVRHVVVGYNYLFGYDRGGDARVLKTVGESCGFGVTMVPPVRGTDGVVCSSTRVRMCLIEGRLRDAARLLGRYFEVEGRVERGDQRGRQLGYPTANLRLGGYQRPRTGVYAVCAGIDRGSATLWQDGIANYGCRPSFGDYSPVFEVHLFRFSEDIYHRHLRVALVEFLRPERCFESLDTLRVQIAADSEQAEAVLQRVSLIQ